MNPLRFFRRAQPIQDVPALADFIDEQASFLAQKGLYEYSRARAGHYAKVLFTEPDFVAAIEVARWRAFPLALAMVAEMIDGVLRDQAGPEAIRRGLVPTVMAVFDRYPPPPSLGTDEWVRLRSGLAARLGFIGVGPAKRAIDVPEPYVDDYFELMPIHRKLRDSEHSTTRSYLRVTLCNIHDRLIERMSAADLVAALASVETPV